MPKGRELRRHPRRLRQIQHQHGEIGRGDSADAAGLADVTRAHESEFLFRFGPELWAGMEVEA